MEQLLIRSGIDRTPLSSTVEENLDNPEFFEAAASLDLEAARIVIQEGDKLHMMTTQLYNPSTREEGEYSD